VSISRIGSDNTAALLQQLKADQKVLLDDQTKKAAQTQILADEKQVTSDQEAIAKAATPQTASPAYGPAGGYAAYGNTTSTVDVFA
jgi:hypothetical protein